MLMIEWKKNVMQTNISKDNFNLNSFLLRIGWHDFKFISHFRIFFETNL